MTGLWLIGPAGAGKTTYARQLAAEGWTRIPEALFWSATLRSQIRAADDPLIARANELLFFAAEVQRTRHVRRLRSRGQRVVADGHALATVITSCALDSVFGRTDSRRVLDDYAALLTSGALAVPWPLLVFLVGPNDARLRAQPDPERPAFWFDPEFHSRQLELYRALIECGIGSMPTSSLGAAERLLHGTEPTRWQHLAALESAVATC